MAHLLGAEAISLEFASGVVFDAVTTGIQDGDRIGVVGRNGDGKSTLLKLLSGQLKPHLGRVTARRNLLIGTLSQSDALDPNATVGHVLVGDAPEHTWASNAQARAIIEALTSEIEWTTRVADLSGGQRRRVALAALLLDDHDVLLLDEPTNHLDIDAITWLAQHLKTKWQPNSGGLVVVTHDRWFLDEVCTTTWEVHDRTIEPFDGGYAAYVLQRVERDRIAASTEAKRQNLVRKELAWLRRGPPARTSKPKFRIDAANALIADEPPMRNTIELNQMAMSRLGKDVVDVLGVSVEFAGRPVLRDIEWRVGPGDRIGILGRNGAGKSTLLNVFSQLMQPTRGVVTHGKTVKLATLTQQSEALDEVANRRVRELLATKRTTYTIGKKEVSASQLFERLGFSSDQINAYVNELSGGQKRRLQLLLILLDEPNVLVLDEPSNDLDIDMLTAMEDLLDSWPGTLIVVSHDRYMVERVTDMQYALLNGRLIHMPRGVEQYVDVVQSSQSLGGTSAANQARGSRSERLSGADLRALQKERVSIERKLDKLPRQIEQMHQTIADHDQNDYVGLAKLAEDLTALNERGNELEQRWLELSEILES